MTPIEKYYNKHKEDHRLTTRHGMVEYLVSMKYIHDYLPECKDEFKIADIGAGTGRYSVALANEGYDVTAVELVKHNLEILESKHAKVKCWPGDARDLSFLPDNTFDLTIFFGPLYHLHSDEDRLKAFCEVKRITKPGGIILAAYVMNDYSVITYCFREERINEIFKTGHIDDTFHVRPSEEELYEYVRLEDVERLNRLAGLKRMKVFSPDGPSDYMRRELNAMSEETFSRFVQYQMVNAERPELLGAGSHLVDVLKVEK
ncbi:class I SAM-dependent methyltransferase [Treponema sp.]|uniref:class I SAM-dependent methyltransferase n=1 Tax=Treponema sp. TaxID=166 RepID=UPI00298E090B|nr:class I SAM-dependent methyltransferase [Treponema sp.]MCQ2241158.1 methyltransferase domain-containing protein [Treponema sp.]